MFTRSILAPLLAVAVIGPVAVLVLFGVGRLLAAMGDEPGGHVIWIIAWVGAGLLVVDAFAILVVLASDAVNRGNQPPQDDSKSGPS